VKGGAPLLVWNRSPSKCGILAEAGAAVAKDPAEGRRHGCGDPGDRA